MREWGSRMELSSPRIWIAMHARDKGFSSVSPLPSVDKAREMHRETFRCGAIVGSTALMELVAGHRQHLTLVRNRGALHAHRSHHWQVRRWSTMCPERGSRQWSRYSRGCRRCPVRLLNVRRADEREVFEDRRGLHACAGARARKSSPRDDRPGPRSHRGARVWLTLDGNVSGIFGDNDGAIRARGRDTESGSARQILYCGGTPSEPPIRMESTMHASLLARAMRDERAAR